MTLIRSSSHKWLMACLQNEETSCVLQGPQKQGTLGMKNQRPGCRKLRLDPGKCTLGNASICQPFLRAQDLGCLKGLVLPSISQAGSPGKVEGSQRFLVQTWPIFQIFPPPPPPCGAPLNVALLPYRHRLDGCLGTTSTALRIRLSSPVSSH